MATIVTRFVKTWPSTSLRHMTDDTYLTQCLWGDTVEVLDPNELDTEDEDARIQVYTRGKCGRLLFKELTDERPLDVNFVDVGQGDGMFIVTPDNQNILVDAGRKSNMSWFLDWRFYPKSEEDDCRPKKENGRAEPVEFDVAIITHPDADHYAGFRPLFDDERFRFKKVFHNGIVERAGPDPLGPSEVHQGQSYLTDLVADQARLRELLGDENNLRGKNYAKLLWTALNNGRVDDIRMLAAGEEAFEATNVNGRPLSMKVLAPVKETVNGRPVLRWFDEDPGKTPTGQVSYTKNGHSVVTILQYGRIRILLGGDLNIPAEYYLMQHYMNTPEAFRVDVAKACHHGSADFSTQFLDWINPLATVICSGDDENYSHPRADSLGTVGKFSRGERSLIFSTELARSAPEKIVYPEADREKIMDQAIKMVDVYRRAAEDETTEELDQKFEKAKNRLNRTLNKTIQRSVDVYGMITLRTDGEKVLMAQRLEKAIKKRKVYKRKPKHYDHYCLVPQEGVLAFESEDG